VGHICSGDEVARMKKFKRDLEQLDEDMVHVKLQLEQAYQRIERLEHLEETAPNSQANNSFMAKLFEGKDCGVNPAMRFRMIAELLQKPVNDSFVVRLLSNWLLSLAEKLEGER
jgi:hypothetical protein